MKKEIIVSAIVALVVAGGVIYFAPAKKVEVEKEKLGAVPGLELTSDGFTINGMRTLYTKQAFRTGTSTVCSIPKPIRATSTLFHFAVTGYAGFASSGKGAYLDMAVVTTGVGTSSAAASATTSDNVIGGFNIFSGNRTNSVVASNTLGAAGNLNVNTADGAAAVAVLSDQGAGTYAGYAPTGNCEAIWIVNE